MHLKIQRDNLRTQKQSKSKSYPTNGGGEESLLRLKVGETFHTCVPTGESESMTNMEEMPPNISSPHAQSRLLNQLCVNSGVIIQKKLLNLIITIMMIKSNIIIIDAQPSVVCLKVAA